MAVPAIIAAIRLGQVLYRVSTSPAAQALAKKAIEKYGGKIVNKTTKELKGNKYITEKVLKQKDPTIPQQIGGRVNRILGKGKDSVITKKSPGVNKSTAGISGPRQAAEKTGRAVIGSTAVGVPSVAVIAKLRSDLKKAKTAEQRAKLQTRIEKEVAKVKAAEQKAKDKGDTKSRTENRNTRRGSNMKVPQGTRVPTSKPGVKRSLRPQLRPKK